MIKKPLTLIALGFITLVSVSWHIDRASNEEGELITFSRWKPLDTKPLLYAETIHEGSTRVAVLNQILLRDPRDRYARLELTKSKLTIGSISDALDDITILYQLDPENRAALHIVLEALYFDKESQGVLIEFAKRRPQWLGSFTSHIVQVAPLEQSDGFDHLFDIYLEGEPDLRRRRGGVQRYVNRLLAIGHFRRARRVWLDAFDISDRSSDELVYNPNFYELVAPPPFNWEIKHPERLSVYSELSGGIRVVARNIKPEVFARQVLPVPVTGRAVVEVGMKDLPAHSPVANLELKLKCRTEQGEGKTIWSNIFNSSFISGNITVPPICSWLIAELFVLPSSRPSRDMFHLENLQILDQKGTGVEAK